jgi:hypothetical protein
VENERLLVQEIIDSKKVKQKLFRKQFNIKQKVTLNTPTSLTRNWILETAGKER